MTLAPLKQWICDTCREVITSPGDGWVEWRMRDLRTEGFRVVHHSNKCQDQVANADLPLEEFLGEHGLIVLLSLVDPGAHFVEEWKGPYVSNLREWVELVKRLQVPYYEEARQHFPEMSAEGFMSDTNEVALYLPDNLQVIIERYSEDT